MRRLAQPVLIALVALTFASIPALSAPHTSLGVITGAERAWIAQVDAVDGTSVYDGDTVTTDKTGAMRLRLGLSQLVLAGNTTVTFHKTDAGVSAELVRGVVRFSMTPGSPLEVHALDSLVVREKGDSTAVGQLTLVSPTTFEIGSSKGTLTASIDGTEHDVAQSQAFRVSLDQPDNGQTSPTGKRGAFWIWFPIALIAAGTTIGLVIAFLSPGTL
ncbi:MAG TPA: hypothetical protein VGZ48_05345 [Candidatus Acidoferrales bacterium]|nr:hypothetical protein [Candidatus Acidoferrales bacterium]